MLVVETPKISTLRDTYRASRQSILCTPYFTKEGLDLVRHEVASSEKIELVIRLNVYDWANGVADLNQLREFIQFLTDNQAEIDLYLCANLHAKIYASKDQRRAYFGSANLTLAAFSSNFEIMTYLTNDESKPVLQLVEVLQRALNSMPLNDFLDIITVCHDAVERVRPRIAEMDLETDANFNAAVTLFSEELHNKVRKGRPTSRPKHRAVSPDEVGDFEGLDGHWPSLDEFIDYCRISKSRDARDIVARHEGQSNLQGHIKHMFYGALFFFYENPDSISLVPEDLLTRERTVWAQEPWIRMWIDYLGKHSGEFYNNLRFNYDTLMTYLPTILGGVQESGGASSGNFKKVIYHLSRMLQENYT